VPANPLFDQRPEPGEEAHNQLLPAGASGRRVAARFHLRQGIPRFRRLPSGRVRAGAAAGAPVGAGGPARRAAPQRARSLRDSVRCAGSSAVPVGAVADAAAGGPGAAAQRRVLPVEGAGAAAGALLQPAGGGRGQVAGGHAEADGGRPLGQGFHRPLFCHGRVRRVQESDADGRLQRLQGETADGRFEVERADQEEGEGRGGRRDGVCFVLWKEVRFGLRQPRLSGHVHAQEARPG